MKKVFLLFLWAIILCFPLFIQISSTFPRLDTDYDSSLPVYQYMVNFFWSHKTIPLIIPYINNGLPVLGDPLNSFLNPLLGIPLLFFGINTGIRITIILSCFLSGITMYLLLRSYKLKNLVILFGSFLYMSGGAFFAAIAAGHIEKFLIYPLVPLLLLFSIKEKLSVVSQVTLGLILAGTVYSGDLYNTWFFLLIFFASRLYYLIFTQNKIRQGFYIVTISLLFMGFSLIKLYSFVKDVLPIMRKSGEINAFKGSLPWYYFSLPFMQPLGVWFWDRPFFQRHLGFYYNWYEYFAFISPLPFIFFSKIKNVFRRKVVVLLVMLLVGVWYFSLMFPYSPFFWLFHMTFLQNIFRVPQRIVLPMTAVVIALISLCANEWYIHKELQKAAVLLFCLSLLWVCLVDWQILFQTFPKNQLFLESFFKEFIQKHNNAKVTNLTTNTQYLLIKNNVSIQNYYYGWISKNRLQEDSEFIITSYNIDSKKDYSIIMKSNGVIIWQKTKKI